MKKVIFSIVFIFIASFSFADEIFKVKVEFVHGSERTITYQYAILTDKGQFIEVYFNEDGTYDRIVVERYTKVGNKYLIPTSIGITMELEREGNDLVLRRTGKRFVKVTDVNLLGM
jgi:hypothetical protein